MRRFLYVVAGLSLIAAPFASAYVRGSARAAVDHVRGRRMFFELGCVSGPSRDPVAFRFEELLVQKYGLYRETVGGYAPTPFVVNYTEGYNRVSYYLMTARYGKDFAKRTQDEAARDVIVRPVTLHGCYGGFPGYLRLATNERLDVIAPGAVGQGFVLSNTKALAPVVLSGQLTEVRSGDWNHWHGRVVRASAIERESGDCGTVNP